MGQENLVDITGSVLCWWDSDTSSWSSSLSSALLVTVRAEIWGVSHCPPSTCLRPWDNAACRADRRARLPIARSELALSVDPSLVAFKHLNSSPITLLDLFKCHIIYVFFLPPC